MAASAFFSNSFSLSYSKPPIVLALQPSCSQHFVNPRIPISRIIVGSYRLSDSYCITGSSRFFSHEHKNERPSFFKCSVSARQEPPAHQVNIEDGSSIDDIQVPVNATEKKHTTSIKSLLLAYKAAILHGDERSMREIGDMVVELEKETNELAQKVSALSAEISLGKEKYVRLQADFDNYRKRSEKERLTVRSDAQGEVIESLLPMVDSFERAKQHMKLETEKEKKIDASYQGIYKQFVEIMRSLRVAAVPTLGKPFDPSVHEAIAREESEEFKEGIIIQEFRRGFYLGDRLLRPAMVKVSSGPGKKKHPQSSSEQAVPVAGFENQ